MDEKELKDVKVVQADAQVNQDFTTRTPLKITSDKDDDDYSFLGQFKTYDSENNLIITIPSVEKMLSRKTYRKQFFHCVCIFLIAVFVLDVLITVVLCCPVWSLFLPFFLFFNVYNGDIRAGWWVLLFFVVGLFLQCIICLFPAIILFRFYFGSHLVYSLKYIDFDQVVIFIVREVTFYPRRERILTETVIKFSDVKNIVLERKGSRAFRIVMMLTDGSECLFDHPIGNKKHANRLRKMMLSELKNRKLPELKKKEAVVEEIEESTENNDVPEVVVVVEEEVKKEEVEVSSPGEDVQK